MQNSVLTPIVLGWVRHALTAGGAAVFAKSCDLANFCVNSDVQGQIVGAAMIAVSVVWSSYAKRLGV